MTKGEGFYIKLGIKFLYLVSLLFSAASCSLTPSPSINENGLPPQSSQETQSADQYTQEAALILVQTEQWVIETGFSTNPLDTVDPGTSVPVGGDIEPTAWIGPNHALETRTGHPEIDNVIDIFLYGSGVTRAQLVKYQQLFCIDPDGLGLGPLCVDGEKPGTQVDVFPVLYIEGIHVRPERIQSVLEFPVDGLFGVYVIPDTIYQTDQWPVGDFAILFTSNVSGIIQLITAHITESSLVRLDINPAYPIGAQLWPEEVNFLLPPIKDLDSTPYPVPVCTPPACLVDEVYYCPADCLGGCGTSCATPTLLKK